MGSTKWLMFQKSQMFGSFEFDDVIASENNVMTVKYITIEIVNKQQEVTIAISSSSCQGTRETG